MYYKEIKYKVGTVFYKAKPLLVQVKKYLVQKFFSMEDKNPMPTILEEINIAKREWHDAKQAFDYASKDSVDYAVYRLNATERKYIYLLNEAKNKGLNAWSYVEIGEEWNTH